MIYSGRSLPEIPGPRKPLPSVPPYLPTLHPKAPPQHSSPEVPKESKPDASSEPQIPPDQDYENMFLGKWNCKADRSNELGFNKGDKLYIISREFDDKSWWVAELNGKFGLVPKNYLTPAYELARWRLYLTETEQNLCEWFQVNIDDTLFLHSNS